MNHKGWAEMLHSHKDGPMAKHLDGCMIIQAIHPHPHQTIHKVTCPLPNKVCLLVTVLGNHAALHTLVERRTRHELA